MKKYIAEMIGTMVLVLMGCGSAVIAGGAAEAVGTGVGTIGVAMAFAVEPQVAEVAFQHQRLHAGLFLQALRHAEARVGVVVAGLGVVEDRAG